MIDNESTAFDTSTSEERASEPKIQEPRAGEEAVVGTYSLLENGQVVHPIIIRNLGPDYHGARDRIEIIRDGMVIIHAAGVFAQALDIVRKKFHLSDAEISIREVGMGDNELSLRDQRISTGPKRLSVYSWRRKYGKR